MILTAMQQKRRSVKRLCGVKARLQVRILRILLRVSPAGAIAVQHDICEILTLPTFGGRSQITVLVPSGRAPGIPLCLPKCGWVLAELLLAWIGAEKPLI